MSNTWNDILSNAKKQTDQDFASRVSSLTSLTDAEIKAIAPTPADREKLAQLLAVLNDASSSNAAKAAQIKSVSGLVDIAVPLLKTLL